MTTDDNYWRMTVKSKSNRFDTSILEFKSMEDCLKFLSKMEFNPISIPQIVIELIN